MISSSLSRSNNELVINVEGRFDFNAHIDFRSAYEDIDVQPQNFSVDMSRATYLDSSALGMLLLLRDYAGGDAAEIKINNCNEDVKKILQVANFTRLFVVD